jgi:hypothetical protein
LADSGSFDYDFVELLEEAGEAAKTALTVIPIFIDRLQNFPDAQIGALISAIHRCAQHQLPLIVIGTGSTKLPGHLGKIRSYSERLFKFYQIS